MTEFCPKHLRETHSNSKYDLILECENDVKLPYVLFGAEKKTTDRHGQTDFQKVMSEKHWSHRILL